MRKTFWYIVGGQLATISIPALAQDSAPEPVPEGVGQGDLSSDQTAVFDNWPAEQQASYSSWPSDAQTYFWTLSPERQEVFFLLRDEDKLVLAAMDDASREAAWMDIERRLEMMSAPEGSAAQPTAREETMPDELMAEEPMRDEPVPLEPDVEETTEPEGR